uniref:RING-type domain-containing protein n=1 Tax=Eutreptiella gymnastica TaxID=73025 RepID=A0A7S1IH09_9EUGL
MWPVVASLSYEVPGTGRTQSQHTFMEVVLSGAAAPALRILKQKLEIQGQVFELEEIYGLGHEERAGADAESVEGDLCVVCITNPRDTMAMPCRHMCLCSECAEELRMQTTKCPICRTRIERLVTIHRRASPTGEGEGGEPAAAEAAPRE